MLANFIKKLKHIFMYISFLFHSVCENLLNSTGDIDNEVILQQITVTFVTGVAISFRW